jgi:hypothetical protein
MESIDTDAIPEPPLPWHPLQSSVSMPVGRDQATLA